MLIEEREQILAELAGRHDLNGQRNYALALFLFYSGLRESEVVHLKVDDVHSDTEHPYLRLCDGNQKDRAVPIVPRLRDGLRVYLKRVRPALHPPADKP